MRILVLFAHQHWTGPASPELQKLEALKKQGHEITFCFTRKPDGTLKKVVQQIGFASLENVLLYRKRPSVKRFWKDLRILKKYCEYWNPDIIHCHLSHDHWTGVFLHSYCLRKKPILVRTIHESRKLSRSAGDAFLHNRTDGFLVLSKNFKQRFGESYNIPEKAIGVIGGVVDVNLFKPGLDVLSIFKEIDAPLDTTLIGIVSRIKQNRGHRELIQAFRQVKDKFPKVRLLIIGRGEWLEMLKSENEDLIQANQVHFLGYRKDDLPNILNALSFKVLLGEGSDGTCRAALEAMSCQTPVVAADIGILPETVSDGKTGLLVPQGDKEFLEVVLDSALSNPGKMDAMGKLAREIILKEHSITNAAKIMESFYQRLIKD